MAFCSPSRVLESVADLRALSTVFLPPLHGLSVGDDGSEGGGSIVSSESYEQHSGALGLELRAETELERGEDHFLWLLVLFLLVMVAGR